MNLYIDGEIKANAISLGINLSRAFTEFLSMEIEIAKSRKKLTDKEQLASLKQKLALVSGKLAIKSEEFDKLKLKIVDPKDKTKSLGFHQFPK